MHEGKRLKLLIKGSDKKQEDIASEMGYSSTYLGQLYKKEAIPEAVKEMACNTFNIGMDYFAENGEDAGVHEKISKVEAEIQEVRQKIVSAGMEAWNSAQRHIARMEKEAIEREAFSKGLVLLLWELVEDQAQKEGMSPKKFVKHRLNISPEVLKLILKYKPKPNYEKNT